MKETPTASYAEALIEVNEYRKRAEEEAKRAILEAVTPLIKKELDRNLAALTEGKLFEEEDPFGLGGGTDAPPPSPEQSTDSPGGLPVDAGEAAPPAAPEATPPTPPIAPASVGINVPLPDSSGKIVVDLADLFQNTPDGQEPVVTGATDQGPTEPTTAIGGFPSETGTDPMAATGSAPAPEAPIPSPDGAAPTPPAPAGEEDPFGLPEPQAEGLTYESFKEAVERFQYNLLGRAGQLNKVVKYALEEQLFGLFGQLQTLKENKGVGDKIAKLQEVRLDHLYSRLQESSTQVHTYSMNSKDQPKMTSNVRTLAKKLFEDVSAKGSAGFGDTSERPKGDAELDKGNAAGKHAISASDSTPVKDPGKEESLTVGKLTEAEEAMALEAELKEMFGEDEEVQSEASTANPGAAEVLDDKVAQGMDKTKPGKPVNTGDVAVMEAKKKKKEELSKKMKNLKEEQAKIQRALKECGGEMSSMGMADEGVQLPVNGTSSGPVSVKIDIQGLDGMGAGAGSPVGLDDISDDDELEIVDDDGSPLGDHDDLGGFSPDGLDADDSDEGSSMYDDVDANPSMPPKDNFEESRKRTGRIVQENKKLKAALNEHSVMTARALCVSKLFTREGLTLEQKRKISQFMDLAQTVNEAKEIYARCKRILDENKSSKNGFGSGASSAVTTGGGSVAASALNENVNVEAETYAPTRSRWMHLAGISTQR